MSTISENDKRVVELVRKSRERASAALPDEPSHARAVYAEGYVAGALGETIPGEYDSHPAIRRIWNGGFEAGAADAAEQPVLTVDSSGVEEWRLHGELHLTDGPARQWSGGVENGGGEDWWLNGVRVPSPTESGLETGDGVTDA